MRIEYLLPLLAGILYALAAMFIKRALAHNFGAMRVTFVTNWLLLPAFAWILFWDHCIVDIAYWWAPLIAGLIHFVAVALMFSAIRVGDVSVQTPIMGSKVLFVTLFTIIFGAGHVSGLLWIAAILSMVGVYILGRPKTWDVKNAKTFAINVGLSMGSAFGFAITDVMAAKYSGLFGNGPFLVFVFGVNAVSSFALVPFLEGTIKDISLAGWSWAITGVFILLGVALMYFTTIAYFKNATAVNILYSSRVIWSVVFVWVIGGLFANNEKDVGKRVMLQRLMGAMLLFASIILVLTSEN